MKQYELDGYQVTEHSNGCMVREKIYVAPMPGQRITIPAAEVRLRFTFAEKTAVQADTDPGTIVARDDLIIMALSRMMIDPADANIQSAFDHLVSMGHITDARKEEILTV